MNEAIRQELNRTLDDLRSINPAHADKLRLSRDGGAVLLVLGETAYVLYSTAPGVEGVVNCRCEDRYPTLSAEGA